MTTKNVRISENTSFILNIVRIFAAWLVLIGHGLFYFGLTIFKNQEIFPALQNIGVVALFILAGFLSAYSIERKKDDPTYSFPIYLIEKLCRIWSGLIPALVFILAIDRLSLFLNPEKYHYLPNYNFRTFIGNVFFLQNYLSIPKGTMIEGLTRFNLAPFGSGRPLWTLSVEWWIYIAVGFLFLIVIPAIRRKSFSFSKVVLFLILSWQPIEFLVGRETNAKVNLTFFFIIGFLIFLIYRPLAENRDNRYENKSLFKTYLALGFFIVMIIVGLLVKNAYSLLFIIFFGVFFLSLILFAESRTWRLPKMLSAAASFLAGYTYSLYLVHYSIIDFIAFNLPELTKSQKFWLSFIISHFIAIVMYYLFERHGRTLSTYFIHQYRKLRA